MCDWCYDYQPDLTAKAERKLRRRHWCKYEAVKTGAEPSNAAVDYIPCLCLMRHYH